MKYFLALALAVTGGAPAVSQVVEPVAPVPRFGPGAHVRETIDSERRRQGDPQQSLGRAGPPGTKMPSGQVGPACMSLLWQAGFHTNHVDCPLYLATRPGATEQCTATAGSVSRAVTVTFLDWNPATQRGVISCRLSRER